MKPNIMTEDEVVSTLCNWLKKDGWVIVKSCTARQKGNDIEATKGERFLIVEAKGLKGKLSHTKREKFDSGQIKNHIGGAIVKVLEQKDDYPNAEIAIAYPENDHARKVLKKISKQLNNIGIKLFWVVDENTVLQD